MKMDRKGDIGFLEAITSAMAVCMVLTAFIAFMGSSLAAEDHRPPSFDWGLTEDASIAEGTVVWDIQDRLVLFADNTGLSGVRMTATPRAADVQGTEWTWGTDEGERMVLRHVTCIPSDDGRSVPTVFEVTLCA